MKNYGAHRTYLKGLNKWVCFCNACHEYIDDDGNCSNPWCPEEQEPFNKKEG